MADAPESRYGLPEVAMLDLLAQLAKSVAAALLVLACAVTGPVAYASDDVQDYLIGPGDRLLVSVHREADLSGEHLLDDACQIELPMVGSVRACGLSVRQLAEVLDAKLGACCLVDPFIRVQVKDFGSQRVQVLGQATRKGTHILRGVTTLLDVISSAGGPNAENVVEVDHYRAADARTLTYDLRASDQLTAVRVHDGDVVTLKAGRNVYVEGQVGKPGAIAFRAGITVTQALTLAGGPGNFASLRRVTIIRSDGAKVHLNLKRVNLGRQADMVLGPDDRLIVPRATF